MLFLSKEERHPSSNNVLESPYWSDYFNHQSNWYIEKVKNSRNLLICYGDSWTWGGSLVEEELKKNSDDIDFRSNNIYANFLAQHLDADYVNCAVSGIFNYWIHDRLNILLDHDLPRLCEQYDKIYIVVTLTEVGRDFTFENYVSEFKNFTNFKNQTAIDLLMKAEEFDFLKLKNIQDKLPSQCKMLVGRNFTDTFYGNSKILNLLAPKTWTQLLFEKQGIEYQPNVRIMSHGIKAFDEFINHNQLNTTEYKIWFTNELYSLAKQRIDLLDKSIYNYTKFSKHPTPEGHKIWADYLINFFNYEQT